MKWLMLLSGIFLVGPAWCPAKSGELALADYLSEVKKNHKGFMASQQSQEAAKLKASDGNLAFAPNVFATIQQSVDEKPPSNPGMGDKTEADGFTVGVSKMFSFGTQLKFSYSMLHTDISGASPQMMPMPEAYEGRPTLEVSQPLWRNFGGREARAASAINAEQAAATAHGEAFKQKLTLAEAEGLYWRLALAREVVAVQKDTLERSRKIRQWNAERVRLSLSDKADLFQADTAVKARELELQAAIDEEQSASRAFNAARGIASDRVTEELQKIDKPLIESIKLGEKPSTREDLLAARRMQRVATLSATLNEEKYTPTLDVFGSYSFNSREGSMNDALNESMKSDTPTTTIGLRFSAPLDRDLVNRSRRGFMKDRLAAQLNAERKAFEVAQDWDDLVDKLNDAKKRLQLSLQVEKVQGEKLEYERVRLRRGRTTTYQVLAFEQDFAASQLNRIRAQTDILRLAAQAKTFGGAQ